MKTKIAFYFLIASLLLISCGRNKPSGLYEFVSQSGEVKSFNFISDTSVIISSSESGLSLPVKYRIEKKFIIMTVPELGETPVEITSDGIKTSIGELYVKKENSSVPTITSSQKNNATTKPSSELLAILQNNRFIRANGLTSLLGIDFKDDNQYIMRLIAVGAGELVKITGVYQMIPKGESESQILLTPNNVQKSISYNNNQSFNIDLFVASNTNYTLRKFLDSDVEKFAKENLVLAQTYKDENRLPLYVLEGSAMFYSERKLTQAEQDSIDIVKKKKATEGDKLEEKLKGL